MPLYIYKAKRGPKEVIEGQMSAETKESLTSKLASEGLVAVYVEEKIVGAKKQPEVKAGKVRSLDLDIFTRQLSSLVKSGITLVDALGILSKQTQNLYFKYIISELNMQVKDGKPLSVAMSGFAHIFNPLYINMIKAGEEGGILDEALDRLADYMDKNEEIKTKIASALAYPILLIILCIGTVFILLSFFMPRLVKLFSSLGQTLPLPTRILIAISSFLQANWIWILFVCLIIAILFKRNAVSKRERFIINWLALRIPILAEFTRKENMSKFTRSFALLLKGGISVFRSIEIIVPTLNSQVYQVAFLKMHANILQGASLANGMRDAGVFNLFEINMIAVGEAGGRLEEALLEIAKSYERDLDKILKIATSLIEPVIIIFIGGIVGFMVFAMLLPIFQIDVFVK